MRTITVRMVYSGRCSLVPGGCPYSVQRSGVWQSPNLPSHQPLWSTSSYHLSPAQASLWRRFILQLDQAGSANQTVLGDISEHVGKVRIWTAVSVCVRLVIGKGHFTLNAELYTLLKIFSVTLFEKTHLNPKFLDNNTGGKEEMRWTQLNLFLS
jgi:hypothetical protein